MPLKLMYITNNPITAQIAQKAGVDRIWVDMEYIGKELRQGGMNTVQNHHTIEDIKRIREVVTTSQLMVRVNPIHEASVDYCDSQKEIEDTINAGADVIMLPMYKTVTEVERFVKYIDKRATVQLLMETKEAVDNIDEVMCIPGVDEIHVGLNDLHLAYGKTFMFELLCDGTVEKICNKLANSNIKYGFGGIARVGFGLLPAEYIIAEHYHLGSTAAILSRGFCDANLVKNPIEIENIFIEGVANIRRKELEVSKYVEEQYQDNMQSVRRIVTEIVEKKGKHS